MPPDDHLGPPGTGGRRLVLSGDLRAEIVAWCLQAYPEEGCGLIAGDPLVGVVLAWHPTPNAARSGRLYRIDGRDYLRADRAAESANMSIIGVVHSHTHTDPYPSLTDVEQAPDPSWHYVLVSLRHELASVRSYRIVDGTVTEEPVTEEPVTEEPVTEEPVTEEPATASERLVR